MTHPLLGLLLAHRLGGILNDSLGNRLLGPAMLRQRLSVRWDMALQPVIPLGGDLAPDGQFLLAQSARKRRGANRRNTTEQAD